MTKLQYVYFLKDHLGNNQIAFQVSTTNGVTSYTVKNTTDFYPFGMEFKNQGSSSMNTYLFGGKEIDRMQGLMEYDFGARWYDPIIGRWGTLDPMAENNYSNTPYKYSNNNPENYIDPDGREETNENGNTPIGWDKYGQPIYDPATYYNPGYPNGMSSYYAPDYTSDSYTPQPVNDNNLPQITVTPDWGSYLGYQLNKLNDSGTDLSAAQERAANYGTSFLPFQGVATQDNRLVQLPAAAGMTVDAMSTTGATIKVATNITETALSHALTRPTTLIGAALAGIPAAIDMYQKGFNVRDLTTIGISTVAILLEFSPEGAAVNIASGLVSLGGVAWDAYTMTHPDNQ